MLDDIDGAAVLGGDDGQAAGGGLDQRQAKGFGQCRIDEHAARCRRDLIQQRYVVGAVMLGVGGMAVQIVQVDLHQDVGQHLLRAAVEVADVVAVAGDDDQVRRSPKLRRLAVDRDQGADVLAFVWS